MASLDPNFSVFVALMGVSRLGGWSPGSSGILVLTLPRRVRWSFVDQVLVSGASFLTGVILIRALGLEVFGVYALILVGVQFLMGVQEALILNPMMSLYDQRGEISASRYLGVMIVHQAALSVLAVLVIAIAALVPGVWDPAWPITPGLVALLAVCMQVQDLARRYFFVTERPARAFACDVVAHGGRLAVIAWLGFSGGLTIDLVWGIVIGSAVLGCLVLVPDLRHVRFDRGALETLTLRHRHVGGWMLATMLVAWFSESGFVLMVIGATLGAAEVGAVRAVQNLVLVLNLVIQSMENFVPSTASQRLVAGGPAALQRYLVRIGAAGTMGTLAVVAGLVVLAAPIMDLLYGYSVPGQIMILVMFGLFLAMGFLNGVVYAGLRAVSHLQSVFLVHIVAGLACVLFMAPAAQLHGVFGALGVMLAARAVMTGRMVWIGLERLQALAREAGR
jgi:O-antigen/teichoic acid export membrane protein